MAKLDNLKQQLENIKKQIADEEKRIKKQQAKERKRKIAIIGAYYLDQSEKDNSLSKLARTLDKDGRLNKKSDRTLFGLSDSPKSNPTGDKGSTDSQKQTVSVNE